MSVQYTSPSAFLSFPVLLIVFTIPSQHCSATDTLTQSQQISVGQTLISSGQIFELGFFSPSKSSKQYAGIWYKKVPRSVRKVIWVLTEDDPSPGEYVCGFSLDTPPWVFIWNGSRPYWRSGPWDGSKFIGVVDMDNGYGSGFNLVHDNQQGSVYITWHTYNTSDVQFMFLTPDGTLTIMLGNEQVKNPYVTWMASLNRCDIYGVCGPFGVCNNNKSPNCECLKGFVPSSTEEWWKGNWAGGCVRKTELLCEKNPSSLASSGKAHNDGFWKLSSMKLPDHHEYLYTEDSSGCQQWCFGNCSCVAYAYVTGIHCMVWSGGLLDNQQFSLAGNNLFLRLSYSELGKDKKNKKFIIIFATFSGVVLLGAFMYGMHRWSANQRVKRENMRKDFKIVDSMDTSELPIIDFDKILVATDNFSTTNKLGEGGFGPVYKGRLEDGYQVAVKRLSRHSGQGVEEFKNEIVLIFKLQHRNLGRLLGCSIEGEEKLLVYEYMTNKSLDTFLFDATKRVKLDWAKHFHIIQGIARGLLYLHRDSCLRVIQRDLKANNILLDNDMNPKISDFGLARTFRVTQELENMHRVMETL
ncbi:hypothetical protein ACSBR1_016236 [Camellia fascicularis]